jgi:hypothetical protein
MSRGPNFIEREVFDQLMAKIPRADGAEYQDLDTVYGDMSRLVVAWLACTTPEQLRALYKNLGWKGDANVRAFHLAAKRWLELHHPGRCPETIMAITPGPELEAALKEAASQRGVAPEAFALNALRERFLGTTSSLQPRDEWERGLLEAARDCGVSLPDSALSSEGLYD